MTESFAAQPGAAAPAPQVSVIVPAYNHASYVVEALESVRTQTLNDWELIVVDDGSTDGTLAVLQAWVAQHQDPRVRLVHQPNAGSHAAINRGVSMARAPFLAILNSDDRYGPSRLARLLELARQQTANEVLLVSRLALIDGAGEPIASDHWWNRMYTDMLRRLADAAATPNPPLWGLFWGNFTVTTSNFFMSRALWERLGPLRRRRYVLDWDFALRVAREHPRSQLVWCDDVLLDYRLHGSNTILSGALRNHAEAQQTLRRHLAHCLAQGIAVPPHALARIHLLARFLRQTQAVKAVGELKIEHEAVRLRLEHQLAAMTNDRDERQRQIDAMRQSTSWRLTAPLRWLKQRLGSR